MATGRFASPSAKPTTWRKPAPARARTRRGRRRRRDLLEHRGPAGSAVATHEQPDVVLTTLRPAAGLHGRRRHVRGRAAAARAGDRRRRARRAGGPRTCAAALRRGGSRGARSCCASGSRAADELARAIREVADGGSLVDPAAVGRLLTRRPAAARLPARVADRARAGGARAARRGRVEQRDRPRPRHHDAGGRAARQLDLPQAGPELRDVNRASRRRSRSSAWAARRKGVHPVRGGTSRRDRRSRRPRSTRSRATRRPHSRVSRRVAARPVGAAPRRGVPRRPVQRKWGSHVPTAEHALAFAVRRRCARRPARRVRGDGRAARRARRTRQEPFISGPLPRQGRLDPPG